jgi:hypothetical protein
MLDLQYPLFPPLSIITYSSPQTLNFVGKVMRLGVTGIIQGSSFFMVLHQRRQRTVRLLGVDCHLVLSYSSDAMRLALLSSTGLFGYEILHGCITHNPFHSW